MARKKVEILESVNDGLGNKRPLGMLRGDPKRMMAVAQYGDAALIPREKWQEFDEWSDDIKVKDQDGAGACNGHAAATGEECLRWTAGMSHVALSAWYVYAILCRGVDRGSMILDALELLQNQGCAPESEVKYGIIDPRKLTTKAHDVAASFKVELGNRITTADQLGTAVQRRQPINLAVAVGSGFNDLDRNGAPQLARGYCNHAVMVGYGMKRGSDGKWYVKMCNSWSEKWGLNGFCWLPLDYTPTAAAFEAYTLTAGTDIIGDITRPPILIA